MCEQVEWQVKPVEQWASFEVMTQQIYKAEWTGEKLDEKEQVLE